MKLTKSRKEFTCSECKNTVHKGDKYAKRSETIGRPQDSTFENIDGIPTMVERGFRIVLKICASCSER